MNADRVRRVISSYLAIILHKCKEPVMGAIVIWLLRRLKSFIRACNAPVIQTHCRDPGSLVHYCCTHCRRHPARNSPHSGAGMVVSQRPLFAPRLSFKITLPYVALALILALATIYIVASTQAANVTNEFSRQIEDARVRVADS